MCGGEGNGSFDLLLSIWAVLREIFPCLVPFSPPARTICGHVRSGLWCLRVSVMVSQIAVAQRLGGILFPVKGWGKIWNSRTLCGIRAVFFLCLQDDQELIQTIPPFFIPLRSAHQRHGTPG